jgi:antitoxin HigA-1
MARDPIHPGKFLVDELNALNMTATELAGILHVPPIGFTRLFKVSEL